MRRKLKALTHLLKINILLVLFLAISCSNHKKISLQDVSFIDIGGWPRGTCVRIASTTVEDVTHDSLFKYVRLTDGEVVQSIINAVNELTCVPMGRELDLRKVVSIHLVDGEVITIGMGESSGTLYNGRSIQDSDELFEIADSILYLSKDKEFWLPDFLK